MKKAFELCEKYGIRYRMKRFIPDDFRKYNYQIAEQFLNESYVLQCKGKPWTKLFWAGQNIQNLKESIIDIADRGELRTIRNVNEDLERRIFDFIAKKKIKKFRF